MGEKSIITEELKKQIRERFKVGHIMKNGQEVLYDRFGFCPYRWTVFYGGVYVYDLKNKVFKD